MPIYDYLCSACHRRTEVIHGIYDDGPKFCPECGAEGTMIKEFSAPIVHFKGSGWAKKDRGATARSAAKASDEGGTPADSKDGGKPAAESPAETKAPTPNPSDTRDKPSTADKPSVAGPTPKSAAE